MSYPYGTQGTKLWTCKRLSIAIKERLALWWYCHEWFDIYDDKDDSIVSEEVIDKNYKPPLIDICYLMKPYYRDKKFNWVMDKKHDFIFDHNDRYKEYKIGTKLKVYRWLDYYREWDLNAR